MSEKNKKCCCSKKRNIGFIVIVLTGLLTLDIIFKGQVYQRLPGRLQHRVSKRIDRVK